SGFVAGWTTPFAWLVGVFTLCLFALLAAVYLTLDSPTEVREDFRRRALASEIVTGAVAFLTLASAARWAPPLWHNMRHSSAFWVVQGLTAATAMFVLTMLWRRHFRWARRGVAAQVALIIAGWG